MQVHLSLYTNDSKTLPYHLKLFQRNSCWNTVNLHTHHTHHTHTHTQGERENICQIYTINTNTHHEGQAFSTWVLKKKSKCTTCFEHMLIGSCRFMWLQLYTWYIKKNVYKMQLIFVVLQSCIIIWVRFIRS